MMRPPPWMMMPKWKLKLMDMLTPAAGVQERVDTLLLYDPKELSVEIQDKAVFIRRNVMLIPQPHSERFPLSKLRKDQLDKIHEIMEKQQS